MLRATADAVKSLPGSRPRARPGLRPPGPLPQTAGMDIALPLLFVALAATASWLAFRLRRGSLQRQQAISQLLDAADALEARLRAARTEIETVAGHDRNPVRAAMQDLLRQRLWLQENAQHALEAIDLAALHVSQNRARIGALQNRLENTISNLQIQAENLQAAESRISDVDVAAEMTEFARSQVLTQAATAMLAQANSMPRLALQVIGA